jgi:hypothetical protein
MLGDPATVRNVTGSVYAVSGTGRLGADGFTDRDCCAQRTPRDLRQAGESACGAGVYLAYVPPAGIFAWIGGIPAHLGMEASGRRGRRIDGRAGRLNRVDHGNWVR